MSDTWLVLLTSASVAAVISLFGNTIALLITDRRDRLNRQRDIFARALALTVDYREFPYVIRRRRADEPEAERARISEELRELQRALNYHLAWMEVESVSIAVVYRSLVDATRRVAGPMVREAWTIAPQSSDASADVPGLDFSSLAEFESRYTAAVREHLSWRSALRRGLGI